MRRSRWGQALVFIVLSATALSCPQDVLDSLVSSNDTPETGVMAEFANCLLQQSASDPKIIQQLNTQISALAQSTSLTQEQLAPVINLLKTASSPEQRAAAFFSTHALIQTAETTQLLDSPTSRLRAEQTVSLILEFVRKSSLQKSSVGDAASVANAVNELSQLASLTARRDMAASIALRAKIYSRFFKNTKTEPSLSSFDDLFTEMNDAVNSDSINEKQLEDFDRRILEEIQKISPSAKTIAEALDSWHSQLKNVFPSASSQSPSEIDTKALLALAPDHLRSEVNEMAQAIRKIIPKIKREIEKSSGLIDRSFVGLTSQSLQAVTEVDRALEGLTVRVRRITEPQELERLWQSRNLIQLIATTALEASLTKSRTALGLSSVLSSGLARVSQDDESFLSPEALHQVHELIKQQTSESWVRAFINRKMAVVYAQSALLLGEAISIPFTWGASTAAMPATLQAIVTGLQLAGRTALIATSSLNIADKVAQDGVKALVNPSSALDALTIVMLLPRPVPGPVDASSWLGKALQTGNNQVALWLHEAGRMAVVGHTAFGAYQLAFAENIATTLRQQGYSATPADIRLQALGHFAQAFLLGVVEWQTYQRSQALGGAHHSEMVAQANPLSVLEKRLRYMVFPHHAFTDTFKSLSPVLGTPLAGAVSILPAVQYVAYDYLLASESLMYFYASTDAGYFNHIQNRQAYPDLEKGETAVTFIGFDEADLLYAGSHSIDSHRLEREKYGDRYFIYDFQSRQDFLKKIQEHAKAHGPIKYLRIMTHGLPGKLYTGDVAAAAVDNVKENQSKAEKEGWIDSAWLKENKQVLQSFSSWGMAPQARVVFFACLVGANMDTGLPGIEASAGDDFLTAFGETFLSKGGLIDSSIRFLMGIDTIFGGLLNWSAREEILHNNESMKHQPVLPLRLYRPEENNTFVVDESLRNKVSEGIFAAAKAEGLVAADPSEMLQYSAERMWNMLTQLHQLGYRYGVQLEGPWWSTPRYKHAEVAPGGKVVIHTY
jgi:hypothetical protein